MPCFTHLRHSVDPKDALHNDQAPAHDDVIADILHDGGGLPGDEGQQHGGFVQVPEEEQLSSWRRGAAHVTKQVGWWVPEHTVKAQHHLERKRGCFLQVN